MPEPTPVNVRLHMMVEMSDGTTEELEVPQIDMLRLGSGLTCRLINDLRTEGVVVPSSRLDGPKVSGIVLAVRGALVKQSDGSLYTQKKHVPGADLSAVAESEGSEGRR